MFFLEHFIEEVSGMEKGEVVTHPMFRDWIGRARKWYVEKYGESHLKGTSDDGVAMLALFETPFELRFPLTLTWPARSKGLTALHFPRKVLRREDSLNFLVSPPNLERLSPEERKSLRRRVSRVVGQARALLVDTMFADVGREGGAALAGGIRISLEKGVRDVCHSGSDRHSDAVWEFNFAAEKALKAFLWQKSRPVPRTHDVRDLVRMAVGKGLAPPARSWLEQFPTGKDAVRYRYGELGVPSTRSVMTLYGVALSLSAHCARALKRTISVMDPGAVLYLRSPWDPTTEVG